MAISILPIRRNLKFNLNPAKALTWHRDGLNVSQFLNTMSLFFPVGERFFIDSVRHYRDQITDSELKKAVTAFIGQEAMHGREHEEYNDFVAQAGIPLHAQEARFPRGTVRDPTSLSSSSASLGGRPPGAAGRLGSFQNLKDVT